MCAADNVLMLSGYWPAVGTGVAVAFARPARLLIPEDEADLAKTAWADISVRSGPVRWTSERPAASQSEKPLSEFAGGNGWRIGFEGSDYFGTGSYAATHLYGGQMGTYVGELSTFEADSRGRGTDSD